MIFYVSIQKKQSHKEMPFILYVRSKISWQKNRLIIENREKTKQNVHNAITQCISLGFVDRIEIGEFITNRHNKIMVFK
jgi:hypothetical protein